MIQGLDGMTLMARISTNFENHSRNMQTQELARWVSLPESVKHLQMNKRNLFMARLATLARLTP